MTFMWDWVSSALSYIGLGELVAKDATILFLGLDNAGKTTLLTVLTKNQLSSVPPTQYATNESMMINNVKFEAYDLGGHFAARKIWKDYCIKVDGIVYVVDAADANRFEESCRELNALLQANPLKNVPFLIFGNKIDKNGAVSQEQFRKNLGLTHTSGQKHNSEDKSTRQIEVFMCSFVRRVGISDGFKWLSKRI